MYLEAGRGLQKCGKRATHGASSGQSGAVHRFSNKKASDFLLGMSVWSAPARQSARVSANEDAPGRPGESGDCGQAVGGICGSSRP